MNEVPRRKLAVYKKDIIDILRPFVSIRGKIQIFRELCFGPIYERE